MSEARYLAFDLEIAARIPEGANWQDYRPYGITCAAAVASDANEPTLWHACGDDGKPAPRMSREQARALLDDLRRMRAEGYTLVTWNGLGFDFDVLAEESGAGTECSRLALDHTDMMFHAFCELGYAISLARTAQGMGLPGKIEGMSGAQAPELWAAGDYDKVLRYVAQDARATLAVAQACAEQRELRWIARSGRPCRLPLSGGWLSAREARQRPLPDTSWMNDPWPREKFTRWLTD